MLNDIHQDTDAKILPVLNFPMAKVMNGIWLLSIICWFVAIVYRASVALEDQALSTVETAQLLSAFLIFVSWLYFKPVESVNSMGANFIFSESSETELEGETSLALKKRHAYVHAAKARMTELQGYHMISQEYIFPFPYVCQIYHLLNLKHLEEVHSFSLSNLKVVKVSDFQPTAIGGAMRFQTVLESPFNTLRVWRQPLVEVDLILHTPYTVELNIPAYGGKRIAVIFNVLPTSQMEHKLFIDIYSDLQWPKPILQIVLHLAACLTVFEDFPYLRKLAERNLDRVIRLGRISNHETMCLFRRFAELYSAGV